VDFFGVSFSVVAVRQVCCCSASTISGEEIVGCSGYHRGAFLGLCDAGAEVQCGA